MLVHLFLSGFLHALLATFGEVLYKTFSCFLSDLLKTEGVPAAESPRKNQIKETDSAYIKLAKKGGHTGLFLEVFSPEQSLFA